MGHNLIPALSKDYRIRRSIPAEAPAQYTYLTSRRCSAAAAISASRRHSPNVSISRDLDHHDGPELHQHFTFASYIDAEVHL
jgi:hypothetical protein